MVELVDTRDLKSLDRNIVPVQVRPRVPFLNIKIFFILIQLVQIYGTTNLWRLPGLGIYLLI